MPLVSFFALRGRCAHCGSAISHQYWMVELAVALAFFGVWLQGLALYHTLFGWAIVSVLIAIAVYDLRHTIIPNALVYTFIALALGVHGSSVLTLSPVALVEYVAVVALGGIATAAPLYALWLFSGGRWMGFGDVKLALGIGLVLGIGGGLSALMLAFISGALIGVALVYLPRVLQRLSLSVARAGFTIKSEIPFAPFLIAGFFLVYFFDVDVMRVMERILFV